MTTLAIHARRAITAALLAGGLATVGAPTASAEATVTLKLSTQWAVVGLPVTATVTSTESGTVTLSQMRNDGLRATKAGYCGHPEPAIYRALTTRPITAGTPLKVTIQPSKLAYYGGDLFDLGTGCWNQATPFNRLFADVDGSGNSSTAFAVRPLTRIL